MKYNIAHLFVMITFLQRKQSKQALFVSFAERETEAVRIQTVFLAVKRFIQGRVSPLYAIIVTTRQVGIMPSTARLSLFGICQTPS